MRNEFSRRCLERLFFMAFASVMTVGCGGQQANIPTLIDPPSQLRSCVTEAVDKYYAASDVAGLRAAVQAAEKCGPGTGGAHEIAGHLAFLENRTDAAFGHWLAGLRDRTAKNGLHLLSRLSELNWTAAQRYRLGALLDRLSTDHPDWNVRALAAWMAVHDAHLRADNDARNRFKQRLGPFLDLALVGPFDNDQGKGFDAAYPPESQIDLSATYPTKKMSARWRTAYPRDPREKLNVGALLYPTNWQVAYAATAVELPKAGSFELRLSSTSPTKVWVNGQLVFAGRRLGRWHFDSLVLPVELAAGVNRILIKSAHQTGSWLLAARLTHPGGKPVEASTYSTAKPDARYVQDAPKSKAITLDRMLDERVAPLGDGLRAQVHRLGWLLALGVNAPAVGFAEQLAAQRSQSIVGRYLFATALWNNQERGRTADILNALNAQFGQDLVHIALKQARFWRQQKLVRKSKDLVAGLIKKYPTRWGAYFFLANAFKKEGWHAERCSLLRTVQAGTTFWPALAFKVADCEEDLKFYPAAEVHYRKVLEALPNSMTALQNLHWLAQGNDRFDLAENYAQRLAAAWPQSAVGWSRLGETLRRKRAPKRAKAAFKKLIKLNPMSPNGYRKLAALSIQAGDVPGAVAEWRQALLANPDSEKIANRVAWLAPAKQGAWAVDVPSLEQINAIIAQRGAFKPAAGADLAYLLDDEVTYLNPDGSTFNVVTMVAHAINQAGRDQLTKMRIRSGGRHRLQHAFAVGPDDRRVEASSIRGRVVRFRQLLPGSTVVLQYRIDESADSYLAGHMSRQWWFQSPSVQSIRGRWVLWTDKDTKFRQTLVGPVEFEKKAHGQLVRVQWSLDNVQPLVSEPGMPGMGEVAHHVVMSTVPSWETFWKWEQALLVDAFRESPEVRRLADDLMAGATTPIDKINRIQTYLMKRIRYQQDYERTIAGVKPHPAPVVVERQYGDCKDKAVLFITLAKLAGIKAHFALVRTRNAGPVRRQVPMQQFNHAIVYVPAQDGLEQGRFYDPTVDALDVDVLRHDDQGTWSAVYDPDASTHTWRKIPFQGASMDVTRNELMLAIRPDGGLEGDVELIAKGRVGEFLRRAARNPEKFRQLLSRHVVSRALPNAQLKNYIGIELEDVSQPARVRLNVKSDSVTRVEGATTRLKLPIPWSPENWFVLSERRHPLLLGTPRTLEWLVELSLPEKAKVVRLPSNQTLENECLRFSRAVRTEKRRIIADQRVEILCERIPVASYQAIRAFGSEIVKAVAEEIVLKGKVAGVGARPASVKTGAVVRRD
ncbi:MAG: transglutaminase domain-containing protein [Myxococcota bacterium]|nr:transglutaminase domain-containing protein [Myxococcota bacterium]